MTPWIVRHPCRVAVWGAAVLLVGCARTPPPQPPAPAAVAADIEISLFLIGDAGEPEPGDPVLAAARGEVVEPERSVVLFLGDNVYPSGLPDSSDPDWPEMARRLGEQVALVTEAGATGYFVAGNHDWGHGLAGMVRQDLLIERDGRERVRLLPEPGCPGPSVVDVGAHVRLVLLDTQWWFRLDYPPDSTRACSVVAPQVVTDSLRAVLTGAGQRHVVVAAHHPLASGGPHGGKFDWTWHIFPLRRLAGWLWLPLPVIGSAYPLSRQAGVKRQDLSSGPYRAFRDSMRSAFAEHPPLVYAAGHEHNLQVIEDRGGAQYLVVSGAGYFGHTNPAHDIDGSLYAGRHSGFVRLDVTRDGRVRLGVVTVNEDGETREAYSRWLAP
jgi:hypothetical protein